MTLKLCKDSQIYLVTLKIRVIVLLQTYPPRILLRFLCLFLRVKWWGSQIPVYGGRVGRVWVVVDVRLIVVSFSGVGWLSVEVVLCVVEEEPVANIGNTIW